MAEIGIVCERVRGLMEEKGVGIYAISNDTGISRASLSLYASLSKPVSDINSKNLILLAQYFGTSCDYLLGISDSKIGDSTEKRFAEHTGLTDASVENIRRLAGVFHTNVLDDMFSTGASETEVLLWHINNYVELRDVPDSENLLEEQKVKAILELIKLMNKI